MNVIDAEQAMAETERVHIDRMVTRVVQAFPHISDGEVRPCAEQAYHEFDNAPVRDFVLVIAERRARVACERLAAQRS